MPNPWSGSPAGQLPWLDLFDPSALGVTRIQAMSIPGVARGRGILLSLLADKPLVDFAEFGKRSPAQSSWLYRVPGWQGPWQRMAGTLDDHIFYGESLWGVQRGAAAKGLKPILNAWHVPYDQWEVDAGGRICVMDQDGYMIPADDSEVIYLPAAHEGLLAYAGRTMRGAVELERAWIARAKNPIPALDLHETEEANLTQEERQEIVDDWAKARGDLNGSIASTPHNVEARVLGAVDPDLYIEGRNAVRLDIANFFQMPASVMDASTATASLTYVTREGDINSLDAMTIPYWCRPIEDRLSQDDIVPIGHIVRFAFAAAYTEPPGPIFTDAKQALAVITDPAVQPLVEEATTPDQEVPA